MSTLRLWLRWTWCRALGRKAFIHHDPGGTFVPGCIVVGWQTRSGEIIIDRVITEENP